MKNMNKELFQKDENIRIKLLRQTFLALRCYVLTYCLNKTSIRIILFLLPLFLATGDQMLHDLIHSFFP